MESRTGTVGALLCLAMASAMPVAAQEGSGLSLNPDAAPAPRNPIDAERQRVQGSECNFIDFEGAADQGPIGTVSGTPNVTFGASWLGVIDIDSGGSGNFANEPSPDTIAFFLTPAEPIDFDTGVQSMEVFYVASASSVPVTLSAWDGPGGTGNLVDSAIGDTVGTSTDGAPCTGDPNGTFCLWDSIALTSETNNILSVTLEGAVENQFGFDDMIYCTGELPGPVPAMPLWTWFVAVAALGAVGLWQLRRPRSRLAA